MGFDNSGDAVIWRGGDQRTTRRPIGAVENYSPHQPTHAVEPVHLVGFRFGVRQHLLNRSTYNLFELIATHINQKAKL